jgi:beta-N-acetylhexosaminidase
MARGRSLVAASLGVVIMSVAAACSDGTPSTRPSAGSTSTSAATAAASDAPTRPGSTPTGLSPSPATPSAPSSPGGTCRDLAGELSLDQQIGQLIMAGTDSGGMTDAELTRLATLKVGSVLLLGNSTAGQDAVRAVTENIRNGVRGDHGVKVMLAADQEGGQVQRLAGPGFDTIPSARRQADLADDDLRGGAEKWGNQLKRAGIDVDLAPVADVVPTSVGSANEPIGALDRGYGPDPDRVARKDVAFIRGMRTAGIATSVKHFPGLGLVRGNTDLRTHVTDDRTTRHDDRLAGFRAGVRAGVDMVMVSSATYTRIDPDHPATYSRTVLDGMLRDDLGFDGVIISDDLQGAALSDVPESRRALKFIRTGGDLAIVGDPAAVEPMVLALRAAAAGDHQLREQILDAATRVLALKDRYGLADCG